MYIKINDVHNKILKYEDNLYLYKICIICDFRINNKYIVVSVPSIDMTNGQSFVIIFTLFLKKYINYFLTQYL